MGATGVQGAPLGGLGVRRRARRRWLDGVGRVDGEGLTAAVSPVRVGRGKRAGELCEVTAVLTRGLELAEERR